MFHRDPAAVRSWSEANSLQCQRLQRDILRHGAKMLRPGGKLLYSTCTFSLEENECNVLEFLAAHPNLTLIPCKQEFVQATWPGIDIPGRTGVDLSLCRRFYPFGASPGEGQFIALFQKTAGMVGSGDTMTDQLRAHEQLTSSERRITLDFLTNTLADFDVSSILKNGVMISYCQNKFIPEFPLFSCGITLGKVEKHYFKPHHQLFSALGKNFIRKMHMSKNDERLGVYLRGHSFDCPEVENGWAAVVLDGVPLGGVKVVDGVAKNHYPKGLRLLNQTLHTYHDRV